MLRKILNEYIYGKKLFQPLFEKMHFISLYGMNIGSPIDVNTSGEAYAISSIEHKFINEDSIIIFDIGANQGQFTAVALSVLKKINNKLKIFAFEPQKAAYEECTKTLNSSAVELFNYGFSDTEGIKTLFRNNDISTLSSLYETDCLYEPEFSKDRVEINLTTIDSFIDKNKIDKIHYLKMDVEGHEFSILKGAEQALKEKRIEMIQFEFGNVNAISRVFMKDFFDLLGDRYNLYRLLKDGIQKISQYNGNVEIYNTAIYLAINKDLDAE